MVIKIKPRSWYYTMLTPLLDMMAQRARRSPPRYRSFESLYAEDSASTNRRKHNTRKRVVLLLQKKTQTIALVVTFYYVVSISLVFANKLVMRPDLFPYPLLLTWVQLVMAIACYALIYLLQSFIPSANRMSLVLSSQSTSSLSVFKLLSYLLSSYSHLLGSIPTLPSPEFNLRIARKTLPLTVIYVSMVVTNNLCLQYVQVSYYQVARSLTILFSIIFTYLMLR